MQHWRSVTLSILKKEGGGHLQEQTAQVIDQVVADIKSLLGAITQDGAIATGIGGSNATAEAQDLSLRHLIEQAIELSRLLVAQKANYEIWMPEIVHHQQVMFDQTTMEDIGGEDEDNLIERDIRCVTFPGIIKRGNEGGTQLHFRNVISKARVLCSLE